MITRLEIGNVRLFEGTGDWSFQLSRVTAFCGTNSAGKSTIFKCLLMLIQTQLATESEPWSGRLRLTGPLVDLGTFESLVSHNDTSRDITVGISTVSRTELRAFNRLRSIRRVSIPPGPQQENQEYSLSAVFRFGILPKSIDDPQLPLAPDLLLPTVDKASHTPQAFLKEASFSIRSEEDSEEELNLDWSVKRLLQPSTAPGEIYEIFIPVDYFGACQGFSMMDVPKDDTGENVRVSTFMRGILPVGLWAIGKRPSRKVEERQWSYFPLPMLLRDVIPNLDRELKDVHYLGPLRSPAKRFYLTNLDSTPHMDASGEFLPYVLRDHSEAPVLYLPPGRTGTVSRRPLKRALNEWLHYLRTGEYTFGGTPLATNEIDFTSTKDVLLEFELLSFGDESHALADSGFGYSQLLPIVVRGLIAEPGHTIIVEQPEVHLNPALQVRMAEFLTSLSAVDKTVLIETHSEHIVNALRVLAAEDLSGRLAANCKIFYFDTEWGLPNVRNLAVRPDGSVPEWPRGFMGEALSLSSRLLRAQARTQRKANP